MLDDISFRQHQIEPLYLFSDNYAWLISYKDAAWVVDPGDAEKVLAELEQRQLELAGLVITHSHWDHVNGIDKLTERFPNILVYGPPGIHSGIDHPLHERDEVTCGQLIFEVWHTPGHMAEHLSYYCRDAGWLICGDTLFSAGCGRLKQTGNMQALYKSLQRIAALPAETLIFCGHEYTLKNLAFAHAVESGNSAITGYRRRAKARRQQGLPTIPSRLSDEIAINPFLRVMEPKIHTRMRETLVRKAESYLGPADLASFDCFSALRQWKDNF